MKIRGLCALLACACVGMIGCSGGGSVAPLFKDGGAVTDSQSMDQRGEEDLLAPPDQGHFDGATELPGTDPDSFVDCAPGDGCFLDACLDNKDCQSGLCVEHLGGKVCTQFCVEECPAGWACQQISLGGADLLFACLSTLPVLCRPCVDDDDCLSAGGLVDLCLDYGDDGRFCGGKCAGEGGCPAGYQCQMATSVLGLETSQCVAEETCECTETALFDGYDTLCAVTNEHGSCGGVRFCASGGLTDCDAQVPAQEVCNGVDDDCDGTIDDVDCDDANPCTEDSCGGIDGCQHQVVAGSCDDGNACTVEDACTDGLCHGATLDCDDDNICTADICLPDSGCLHEPTTGSCDDGQACTLGDACEGGQCVGVAVDCDCQSDLDCAAFEDDNVCNGTLVCDLTKVPFQCRVDPATVVDCPAPQGADAACLVAWCDPGSGSCQLLPANTGGACTDGDACTLGDQCAAGACTGTIPLNCNDGNPCTLDTCDALQGCQHEAVEGPCNDQNTCTLADSCVDGQCQGSGTLDCDDDNPCTKDVCDPLAGCQHPPTNAPCSDGDACTGKDLCVGGACQPGEPVSCDDDNVCTQDLCDAQVGCLHSPVAGGCDDGNSCTQGDHCQMGKCQGVGTVDCDDQNPCTDDLCDLEQGCHYQFNAKPCDDGDLCTVGDLCAQGACTPGAEPLDCDDENVCTDDSCDGQKGCLHTPNTLACDDGNLCTASDTCLQGKCQSNESVDCNDDNVCTTDLCGPLIGCVYVQNGLPCNDQNACTIADTCSGGVCAGLGTLPCNDGNSCTDDACDAQKGCLFTPNVAPCDDGNPCTVGDTCGAGWCKGAGSLDCEDGNPCTTDYCNPNSGCVHVPNNLPCSDDNPCTVGDVCSAEACQPGQGTLDCDDADPCTEDACDPESGCTFTLFSPCCGNGIVDAGEVCDDGNAVGLDGCSADCASTEECGNEVLDLGLEACDGALFPVTCHQGSFTCANQCLDWVTSGCASYCGDGKWDANYEACDGAFFPTACHDGTFECLFDCKVWDKSGCTGGYCGDGIANGDEDCDGFDFAVDCPLAQCFCSSDCKFYYNQEEEDIAWEEGIMDGVSDDPGTVVDPLCAHPDSLCLDATTSSLSHVWIANSNHHEVVRINVDSGVVEKEIPSLGQHPSRTAVVVSDGSVWVGNRGWNCSGNTECSNLVHFDIDGNPLCKVGITGMVRGVGIDQDGNVWASSWEGHKVYKFSGTEVDDSTDPDTCKQLAVVDSAGCVYGLAGDNKGNIWAANNCGWTNSTNPAVESIQRIDIATNTVTGTFTTGAFGCFSVYGITVDGQGRVLVGSYVCDRVFRFTPESETWEAVNVTDIGSPRGVVVDQNGYVYSAISNKSGCCDRRHVVRIEPDFSGYTALDLGGSMAHPVGVAIDRNGKLWTCGRNSDSCARVEIAKWGNNPVIDHFATNGDDPYTYSDMTGFQHLMFTNPEGTWTRIYDGGADTVYWKSVAWTGQEEDGVTDISVRARSAATKEALAQAGWTAYMTDSPASLVGLPQFRFLEVQMKLASTDSAKTPILTGITIHWAK